MFPYGEKLCTTQNIDVLDPAFPVPTPPIQEVVRAFARMAPPLNVEKI